MSVPGFDRFQVATQLRGVLMSMWPHRFELGELAEEVALGADGLGLDSVEIAELLLECEEETGTPMTEELLAASPLTIGRLIDHLAATR